METILIVEDENAIREMLTTALSLVGFDCIEKHKMPHKPTKSPLMNDPT